ncbi:hypothetical protein LTR49_028586, partial [Elasticomyces elasticus]
EHLPAAGVHSWADIEDILPATDAQIRMVTNNMTDNRTDLGYFAWDSNGTLDLGSFEQALLKLVANIECLRTAFVTSNGRMFQLILAQHDPHMQVFTAESSIADRTREILEHEMYRPLCLGRPFLDVAVVYSKTGPAHRILFRMSHALYDATSLPIIWTALQTAYRNQPLVDLVPFSQYTHAVKNRTDSATFDYWRNLLRGSSMSRIGGSSPSEVSALSLMEVVDPVTVELSGFKMKGITTASVVKAAWAVVLAQHIGCLDVVFADIAAARSAVDRSVANAIGCCATGKPVRIKFQPEWTVADLLQHVQDQQLSGIAHEAVGPDQIIKNSTDWPSGLDFTSSVNHQYARVPTEFDLGEASYTPTCLPNRDVYSSNDIQILTTDDNGSLKIAVLVAAERVPTRFKETIQARLSSTLGMLVADAEAASSVKALLAQLELY